MRYALAGLVALCLIAADVFGAEPPEQFRVWGAKAPALKPVGPDWKLVEPRLEMPLPGLEDVRSGFAIAGTPPAKLAAARGQYLSIAFALYAFEGMKGMTVDVSDLERSTGGTVDARFVTELPFVLDAKAKTYSIEPFLIEKRSSPPLLSGGFVEPWLTLYIPSDAKPGDHAASITLTVPGKEPRRIPITVTVLPFALPPVDIDTSVSFSPERTAKDDAALAKQLVDMREHGINCPDPTLAVEIKSRDRKFGDDDAQATAESARRMMSALKKAYGGWTRPVTLEVGNQVIMYWDQKKNWFVHWPHSPEIDADLLKALDVVAKIAKAESWPPIRVYALDEAGAHNLLDEAKYYYALLKKQRPALGTTTTIGGGMAMGYDEIGALDASVDFLTTNRFTPEIARKLIARGKPFGVYNGAGPKLEAARFFFGFYGFKTGARGILQWCYNFGDSPFAGNGFRVPEEGFVYLAPDGPLPTIPWENVRTGIDDYRYCQLLSQLIASARKSSDPAAKSAADSAEKSLRDVLSPTDFRFQALDRKQRTPAPDDTVLDSMRAKVTSEILRLLPFVKSDPKSLPPAPPRSPFDFAWAGENRKP